MTDRKEVAKAIRSAGFPAADVREGRVGDMGERWIVTEMEADGHKPATDPGFNVDLDADGREVARRPANRIRRREHRTLDEAIVDYLSVLMDGGLPLMEHRPDGRSGASGHDKLTALEVAKLVTSVRWFRTAQDHETVWLARSPSGKWVVLDSDEEADDARAAGVTVRLATPS